MLQKRIIILSGNTYRGVLKITILTNSYISLDLTTHFLPKGDYLFFLEMGGLSEQFNFDGEKFSRRIPWFSNIENIECAVASYEKPHILMSASEKQDLSPCFVNWIHTYLEKSQQNTPLTLQKKLVNPIECVQNSSKPYKNDCNVKNYSSQADYNTPKPYSDEQPIQDSQLTADMYQKEDSPFFNSIREIIEEFFDKYPPYEPLINIVPLSKWVKVDTEDTFYVVGLLYNTSGVTHICYGIPGEYAVKPTSEPMTEWLPLNPEEWEKQGFWMIYQNAQTGHI